MSNTGSWVQDPDTLELIPKHLYEPKRSKSTDVMAPFNAFKSPIDGSLITCRSKLRAHCKKHGVTNSSDYGERHAATKRYEKAQKKSKDRHARKQLIYNEMLKKGII